ncbi:hypothetical protein [Enterococcus spodopteracolus]|uniref:hypothetical protein n=1 Tax=Enterococcus spodopteracolus TaxID=3034501 RepID=UPI002647FA81|nr:hypothetical protein [Enterococcus spodopteracolus]
MNIIQQYEWRYICYEELLEEIWGYGQQLINEVGIDCFSFYVAASGYHDYQYFILPFNNLKIISYKF